jgi:hypothetical protein
MISHGQRRPQISDALSRKTVSRPSKPLPQATHLRFTTGDLTSLPRVDSDGILLRFDRLFFSERVGFWHAARCPYLRPSQDDCRYLETIRSLIRITDCECSEGSPYDYENGDRPDDICKSRAVACLHATSYPLYSDGVGKAGRPCVALIVI